MLKPYYTLQEADEFLSKEAGNSLNVPNVIELGLPQKLRMCFWFDGNLVRNIGYYNNGLLAWSVGERTYSFQGYLQIPSHQLTPNQPTFAVRFAEVLEFVGNHHQPDPTKKTWPEGVLSSYKVDDKGKRSTAGFEVSTDAVRVPALDLLLLVGKGAEGGVDRPLATTERNSLLIIIAALCKEHGIDYKKRGIAKSIAGMTELAGAGLSDETVKKVLDLIPEALAKRSK